MKSKEVLAQPVGAISRRCFILFARGVILAAMVIWSVLARAQYNPNPAPGPYYFVSDSCGDAACSNAGHRSPFNAQYSLISNFANLLCAKPRFS
jgi:hypothetical protein